MTMDRLTLGVHQRHCHRAAAAAAVGIPGQTSSGGRGGEGAFVRGNIFPSGIYMAERTDTNTMSRGTESLRWSFGEVKYSPR